LLLAALRQILGDQVHQRGSNITSERLRFDFSYTEKLTPEQIKKVEDLVNEKIKENLAVDMKEMSLEDAKNCGAIGEFGHKYGYKVKVYFMGRNSSTSSKPPFSREICGGPHVKHTGELGHFKIIKEESSSSGVRRIKAILE
jgi:alanyl-tRNA synthetase